MSNFSDNIIKILLLTVGLIMLFGCKAHKEYVPIEKVRTEYKDREIERIVSDTVNNTRLIYIKGDTVLDIRDRTKTRHVEVHDTCYIERTDSIPVPYPVERKLTRWERTKIDYGGYALCGLAAGAAFALALLIRRFYKPKK